MTYAAIDNQRYVSAQYVLPAITINGVTLAESVCTTTLTIPYFTYSFTTITEEGKIGGLYYTNCKVTANNRGRTHIKIK
jgi:hypothetical protein